MLVGEPTALYILSTLVDVYLQPRFLQAGLNLVRVAYCKHGFSSFCELRFSFSTFLLESES